MMQMPLSSYPHFSQFVQLQQLHQQRYSRNLLSPTQTGDMAMLSARRSGTSCSEASTGTPSPSPSPPLSITENLTANNNSSSNNNNNNNNHQVPSKSAKSFTIDAILGIRDRDMEKINRGSVNVLSSNFHPRLGLHLSGAHMDPPGSYGNSLDLTNSTLEIGTRIDVARFSASSRDILGFPLPTDLTTSSDISNFGSEINRRNLQNQICSFQNSNSCNSISDKSPPADGNRKCGGKSKRVRTIFTPEQLERLEAEFERQQYMVGPERLYLAHTLQLTEAQVKVWFQNRRIKWRKQHLEIQQQRLAAIKQQNRRGDVDESDEESGEDSNNYSFAAETGENGVSDFFKTVDNDPLETNLRQLRDKLNSFHGESLSENIKSESNSENV